ncbi:hypothetical protein EMPG_11253 [Blastomyces silverae]|uniref:Uncharacterized protein n=1 Tax=Blastomyces silverae TaxID=2060906 RepID=A0A0H1BRY1_9EURO|nr:hypothetical protein EMPG_11253 [Blastomyces silverae]
MKAILQQSAKKPNQTKTQTSSKNIPTIMEAPGSAFGTGGGLIKQYSTSQPPCKGVEPFLGADSARNDPGSRHTSASHELVIGLRGRCSMHGLLERKAAVREVPGLDWRCQKEPNFMCRWFDSVYQLGTFFTVVSWKSLRCAP